MPKVTGRGRRSPSNHEGTLMLGGEPAVARLARWVEDRLDRPVLCAYGSQGELSEPRCEVFVTLRASTAAGHPGYCSHAHDALAQDDQVM